MGTEALRGNRGMIKLKQPGWADPAKNLQEAAKKFALPCDACRFFVGIDRYGTVSCADNPRPYVRYVSSQSARACNTPKALLEPDGQVAALRNWRLSAPDNGGG